MKQLPWILVGVLFAALLFFIFFRECSSESVKTVSDTVWLPARIDTMRDTAVAPPVSELPAGTVTGRFPVVHKPVSETEPKDSDTARIPVDSLAFGRFPSSNDSILGRKDSADVIIPITEKEYRTDDYRIVISGYRPQLVSAEFYRRTQTGVVSHSAAGRKRWGIGLSVGYGLSLSGRGEPFVGITLNYNLLQW